MTFWVLGKYGFNLSKSARRRGRQPAQGGREAPGPGLQYGKTGLTKLDFLSLALALVLGTAGLPHVLMRFYTVPSARRPGSRSSGPSG